MNNWKKWALAASFGLGSLGLLSSNALASKKPIVKCEAPQLYSFDESSFSLGKIYHKHESPVLEEINASEGRLKAKFPLGCKNNVFLVGMGIQVTMSNLKVGDGWAAEMSGIGFNPELEYRLQFGDKKQHFVGFGSIHWSYRTPQEGTSLQTFLAQHPETMTEENIRIINAVFAQMGGKFDLSENTKLDGRIGYTMYQATPDNIVPAFLDSSKRIKNYYPRPVFVEGRLTYNFFENFKAHAQIQSEFSEKSAPTNLQAALDWNFPSGGVRAYIEKRINRPENALQTGMWGVAGNGTMNGIEFYRGF